MPRLLLISVIGILISLGSCKSPDPEVAGNYDEVNIEKPLEFDRYCLALDLKPDAELIKEYKRLHTPDGMWPEIPDGIRKSGCLDMEIYLINNNMFMIVEIQKGVSLDKVWEKMGTFDRQPEWAEFMLKFQQAVEGHGDKVAWVLMDKVYDLDDH